MMKNLKFNTKKIAAILSMSLGLTLMTGCSNHQKVSKIVSEMQDTTCLDEVMTNEGLEKIDELLEYIDLSNTMNKLKLKDVDINLEEFNLLSPYDIRKLLSAYKNKDNSDYLSKEDRSLLKKELIIEKYLVNDYIYQSYDLVADFLLAVLKSEILDAEGLDENSIESIKILGEKESLINNTPTTIGDYILLTDDIKTSDKNLWNSLKSLYSMQNKGESNNKNYEPTAYNKGRNKMIKEAINRGIKTAKKEYIINEKGFMKKLKK